MIYAIASRLFFMAALVALSTASYAYECSHGGGLFYDHYSKEREELMTPVYFDVGAGYFNIHDVDKKGDDANGLMIELKAYPIRSHFAALKPKNELIKLTRAASEAAASNLTQLQVDVKNTEDVATKAKQDLSLATSGSKDKETIKSLQQIANQTSIAASDANQKLNDALQQVGKAVTDLQNSTSNVYAICANDWEEHLGSHTYFFLGMSIGDTGSSITGQVKAIGVGYDITPEFSLIAGYAVYKTEITGVTDDKDKLLLGVQLNLAAFAVFRNLVGL